MENFVVSARKYRPQLFDSVVGQSHITTTLKNAIRTNHLAQAFLFCGPRGVGKTTCARILAKTINCQNLTHEAEACGQCESCVSFQNNASFNIHELDAASNNSVDDIRNLIDQVRYPPSSGKYSIYIIDEVHMLSTSAFNAFLKTLEEPPSYAIFILATTEKHKILPTILSRTGRRPPAPTRAPPRCLTSGARQDGIVKAPPVSTKTSLTQRLNHHARDGWPDVAEVELDGWATSRARTCCVRSWSSGCSPVSPRDVIEGLEEMFTVARLGVTGALRRSLTNTNCIESMISTIRVVTGRVKNWRDGDMKKRWIATGMIEAQRSFRRVRGHTQMADLVTRVGQAINPATPTN